MGFRSLDLTVLALLALVVPDSARAQLLGPEFQVNTYTTGDQWSSWVAAERTGEFVVVWMSNDQDGNLGGVFGQQFGADDQELGEEFQINQYTTAWQSFPRVAMDSGGQFMVTWSNFGYRQTTVPARRYGAAGQPLGDEFVVASSTSWTLAWGTDLTADAAGHFVALWTYRAPIFPGFPDEYYGGGGQRYDGAGQPVGSPFDVEGYSVASTGIGGFVVGFPYWQEVSPWEVRGHPAVRRYDALGTVGPDLQVDSEAESWDLFGAVKVASGGAGDFVVAWDARPYFGDPALGTEIFLRRVSAPDGAQGESTKVNSYTAGDQQAPSIAADRKGNFLVVWQSQDQDGSGTGVFGQRFAADGSAVGGEFQVNSYTTGSQHAPSVTAGNVGDFIVSWTSAGQDGSGSAVYARRIRSSIFWGGFELGDPCGWSSVAGASCP